MAFLETGTFCSAEEYAANSHRRVVEAQLQKDELYMMNMRLERGAREAAKLAVRTVSVAQKSGLALVRFVFLDDELNPTVETYETMSDGFISRVRGAVIVDPQAEEEFAVTQAYFRDYFEDQFGGALANSEQLSLS